MITLIQIALAVGILCWSGHGLPAPAALALYLFCAAFVDLFRQDREDARRAGRVPSRLWNENPPLSAESAARLRPAIPPKAPPPPLQRCSHCMAELELAERFNREAG